LENDNDGDGGGGGGGGGGSGKKTGESAEGLEKAGVDAAVASEILRALSRNTRPRGE